MPSTTTVSSVLELPASVLNASKVGCHDTVVAGLCGVLINDSVEYCGQERVLVIDDQCKNAVVTNISTRS